MPSKYTLKFAQELAQSRQGKCLSEACSGIKARLKWGCGQGHTWEARLDSLVHNKSWCRQCVNAQRKTKNLAPNLERARRIAAIHGGKCLETENFPVRGKKVKWECKHGHQWLAIFHNISTNGAWCPECNGGRRQTLEDAHQVAAERGGKCLSISCKDSRSRLEWECAEGHTWSATYHSVKDRKSWCPVCAGCAPKTLEDAQNIATERSGKCLSTSYKNCKEHLEWECFVGHTWKAPLSSLVYLNTWCAKCSRSKSEKLCGKVLSELVPAEYPFTSTRKLPWLRLGKSEYGLELDFYNAELGLAVEYNGKQHYKKMKHFHRTPEAFAYQQERDRLKAEACWDNNVDLIVVPYTVLTGLYSKAARKIAMITYLQKEIHYLGYPWDTSWD